MKQFLLFIFCICSLGKTGAQINYVLNPSFEDYTACPDNWDEIRLATHWSQIDTVDFAPLCSPDYCNECAVDNPYVGVPYAYCYAHYPRTGAGMVETQMYFDESYTETYKRDYLQGRFYTPLTPGKFYCATFYVSLEHLSGYAVNHIGAYIDNGSIDGGVDSISCGAPLTEFAPQIVEDFIINDTLNWIKIQGGFVATADQRFITIGNFFDKAHTNEIPVSSPDFDSPINYTWYLIDDVSVIASDEPAHAGEDAAIAAGDSAFIGPHEVALPYTWYILGNPNPIDSGGGIWVHPDTTTTYVVEQDLCGTFTYDTVTVYVWPAGVASLAMTNVKLYPNPAKDKVTIENAPPGTTITIYNVVGAEMLSARVDSKKHSIDISGLPAGSYIVQLINAGGMKKNVRLVKD